MHPDGNPLYGERYAWCGNFQDGRCPVRLLGGGYLHIVHDGSAAYAERYRYAGDFKDGHAVVQRGDGQHTHIDAFGRPLHGRWFRDLDLFHKRYARACDSNGWHHVDMLGEPLYGERFRNVEPFYNGQARVEGFDGSLLVIDESGQTLVELRGPARSHLEVLSEDMVGFWRTQTISAAVELGVFEFLPGSAKTVERRAGLHREIGVRFMRALAELRLVWRNAEGNYYATERGALLTKGHPFSLVDAARHWGKESNEAWAEMTGALRTGESSFERLHGSNFFDWIRDRPADLQAYHSAMSTYARHDYEGLADSVDFSVHDTILDAGGGNGELAFALMRACPGLQVAVMDRLEVVQVVKPPSELEERCRFLAGDLFERWPLSPDAVIIARVLHDWPDTDALRILQRAREAMPDGGTLYIVEMVLDAVTGEGGLLDMNMLVMTRGAERTEKQFKDILAQAGFALIEVVRTKSVNSVLRARAL